MFASLADAYEVVRPAVVSIALADEDDTQIRFFSFGSGVCVDPSGIIVTARHVVEDHYEQLTETGTQASRPDPEFVVVFSRMGTARFETLYARPSAIIVDDNFDLAILKVNAPQTGWPAVRIPDSWVLREGDEIAAAGFPLRTWTSSSMAPDLFHGVVSRIDSEFVGANLRVRELVLDLAIHPGNSGGPVFSVKSGELVGLVASQLLRELDITLINSMDAAEDDEGLPPTEFAVWTNIAHCVPWTAIPSGIEQLRSVLRQRGLPGTTQGQGEQTTG